MSHESDRRRSLRPCLRISHLLSALSYCIICSRGATDAAAGQWLAFPELMLNRMMMCLTRSSAVPSRSKLLVVHRLHGAKRADGGGKLSPREGP